MKAQTRGNKSIRNRGGHLDSEGTWAVSYGDMITLLLTFFILFFRIDKADDTTEKALKQSLMMLFTPSVQQNVDSKYDSKLKLGNEDGDGLEPSTVHDLGAKIHNFGSRLIVEFPEHSFFNAGKVKLTSEGANQLKLFAQKYLPYAGTHTLAIRAFTDDKKVINIPGRPFEDNLELSALRSVAAMRVLQHSGIPLSVMRLSGLGESKELIKLKQDAKQDVSRALARKVVLVIEPM